MGEILMLNKLLKWSQSVSQRMLISTRDEKHSNYTVEKLENTLTGNKNYHQWGPDGYYRSPDIILRERSITYVAS